MRIEKQPDQCRSGHRAQQLRRPEAGQMRKVSRHHRIRKSDRRVQVRSGTAKGLCGEHAAQNGNPPPSGNDHPSRAFRVGLAQANAGVDPVSQKNEDERPHKFAQPIRVRREKIHVTPLLSLTAASPAAKKRESGCTGLFWLTSAFSTLKGLWGSGSASAGSGVRKLEPADRVVSPPRLSLQPGLRLLPQPSISLASSSGGSLEKYQPIPAIYNS